MRQRLSMISEQGRVATGVLLQRLDQDDHVASATIVPAQEEEDEEADEDGAEELAEAAKEVGAESDTSID